MIEFFMTPSSRAELSVRPREDDDPFEQARRAPGAKKRYNVSDRGFQKALSFTFEKGRSDQPKHKSNTV
jgi:hypothetical protein